MLISAAHRDWFWFSMLGDAEQCLRLPLSFPYYVSPIPTGQAPSMGTVLSPKYVDSIYASTYKGGDHQVSL